MRWYTGGCFRRPVKTTTCCLRWWAYIYAAVHIVLRQATPLGSTFCNNFISKWRIMCVRWVNNGIFGPHMPLDPQQWWQLLEFSITKPSSSLAPRRQRLQQHLAGSRLTSLWIFFYFLWLRRKLSTSTIPIIWTQTGQIISVRVFFFFFETRFQLAVSAKRALQILPLGNICDKMIISMNQKSALLRYIFPDMVFKACTWLEDADISSFIFLIFFKIVAWGEAEERPPTWGLIRRVASVCGMRTGWVMWIWRKGRVPGHPNSVGHGCRANVDSCVCPHSNKQTVGIRLPWRWSCPALMM